MDTHIQAFEMTFGGTMRIDISLSDPAAHPIIYGYLSCCPKSQPERLVWRFL